MGEAGLRGDRVRSDCWVSVDPGGSGLRLDIESKVASMYGAAIREQASQVLATLGVTDAAVRVEDSGAFPFVLAARIEAAVRRSGIDVASPAVPESQVASPPESTRDRLRRSRLYLPGSQAKLFMNAGLHEPDGVILDLEDSVTPAEKDAARILVRNALIAVDFMGAELMVRINQLPAGLDDLDWVVPYGAQLILIPKCEDAAQVEAVDARIASLSPPHNVFLMPIIESALGCFRALDIASASRLPPGGRTATEAHRLSVTRETHPSWYCSVFWDRHWGG